MQVYQTSPFRASTPAPRPTAGVVEPVGEDGRFIGPAVAVVIDACA